MPQPPPEQRETQADETILVDRARQGDREAFRRLVETHQDNVYYTALGLLRNPDDAEDMVQEVFIRAYKFLDRFRGQARLGTWLYRVTLNACRDHQRKRRFIELQQSLGLVKEPESQWVEERADANPERAAASTRLRGDLYRALDRLSPSERSVFVLRQFNDLSIRETAEATGRAEGTVKALLFRALRKLQKELAGYRRAEEAA